MNSAPLIELRGVGRWFDGAGTSGIRDVSFCIEQGEFVAIVGPSGAGKSTLLNLLGLLDRPDAGTLLIEGIDTSTFSERKRNEVRAAQIGFVFQSAFVLGDQSALHNAALGLRVQGVGLNARAAQAYSALREVDIESKWSTEGRLLSGGERQRLAIARAIANRPAVILADEPTGNLDIANSQRVIAQLKALNNKGTTVIIITHDDVIAAEADRQIRIVDGQATEIGSSVQNRDPSTRVSSDPDGSRLDKKVSLPSNRGILDDFSDAIAAMSARVLRTVLLMFAFVLGISGLIAATGMSETAAAQVSERLTQAALDEVKIYVPGGAELLLADNSQLDDWVDSLRELPHVVSIGYVATAPANSSRIRRLADSAPPPPNEYFLISASSEYVKMMGGEPEGPTTIELAGSHQITRGAWLGSAVADELAVATPGQGSTIWVAGEQVEVLGTFGAGERSPQLAKTVVVTSDVLQRVTAVGVTIVIRTEPGYPAAVADAAPFALNPGNPAAFNVETVADLRQLRYGVANDLGILVAVLSAILLALAAVSASTTMYLSVQARAPEIALRRALGASRVDIARLFVAEGVLIGVVGGAAGALVGTLGALLVAHLQGWAPVLAAHTAPLSVGLGLLTGLVSAIVPSWVASRYEPAQAIRG